MGNNIKQKSICIDEVGISDKPPAKSGRYMVIRGGMYKHSRKLIALIKKQHWNSSTEGASSALVVHFTCGEKDSPHEVVFRYEKRNNSYVYSNFRVLGW